MVDYNITAVKLHQQKTSTTVVYCDETDKVGGRHFDIELANLIANRAKDHFKTESKNGWYEHVSHITNGLLSVALLLSPGSFCLDYFSVLVGSSSSDYPFQIYLLLLYNKF